MLRYWLRNVPLMRSLLAFLAGVFSMEMFVVMPLITISFGLLSLLVILFYFRYPSFRFAWIPGSLIIVVFFLFGNSYAQIRSTHALKSNDDEVVVSGYVIDRIGYTSKSQKIEFFADTISNGDALYFGQKGIIYLSNALDSVPAPGRRLSFRLRLMPFRSPDNPGMFDYPQYLLRNGFSFMGYVVPQSVTVFPDDKQTSAIVVAKLKDRMGDLFLKSGVEPGNIGLLQSFFVGDKSELDQDVTQAFMNSGTMHLLAVSGMHVAIIYWLLLIVFPSLRIKGWRYIRFSLILIALWLYGILTGMSPSVLRAIVMMTVLETGRTFQQETSVLNLLVVAVFVLMLIDPFSVYSAGLWLSFAAVAGIVFAYPMLNTIVSFRFPAFQWLWSLIAVSVAAQIGTLPFSLFYFHAFPVYFLLNNLILVPLMTPVLILALLILLFSPLPAFALLFSGALNDLLLLNSRYVLFAEQLPYSVWKYIAFDGFDLILSSILLGLLYLFLNQRIYKTLYYGLMVIVLMLFKFLIFNHFYSSKNELTVFNTPSKLIMTVATPSQTILMVSDGVSQSDVGYVTSGYLSRAGVIAPQMVSINQSTLLCIKDMQIGVLYYANRLDECDPSLCQANIIVVAGNGWPPDDWPFLKAHQVILSSQLSPSMRKQWKTLAISEGIGMHDVVSDGAFSLNIKP